MLLGGGAEGVGADVALQPVDAATAFGRIVAPIRISIGSAGSEAKTSPVRMIAVSVLPPT